MRERPMNTMRQWLASLRGALAPSPRVALGEVAFSIPPHILQRGEQYYLRYQIKADSGNHPPFRMVPLCKTTSEKGYYFFGTPISFPERGSVVERPLDRDGLTNFARKCAIYWLNPDGSEVHLEVTGSGE